MEKPNRTGSEDGAQPNRPGGTQIPEPLRSRLRTWLDVDTVGLSGLWLWLETVLPLLPTVPRSESVEATRSKGGADRVRELASDLVECAGDRARLTIVGEQYFRDNQLLARRVKALESALRTPGRVGRTLEILEDPETTEAAERYLPSGGTGS